MDRRPPSLQADVSVSHSQHGEPTIRVRVRLRVRLPLELGLDLGLGFKVSFSAYKCLNVVLEAAGLPETLLKGMKGLQFQHQGQVQG